MRVISGMYKGRNIDCPKGNRIRPTSDMVRSAIYNILGNYVDWENTKLLDVFCGTGAFGIEAISRGAAFVGFVDNHRESIETTKHNLSKMNIDKGFFIYNYDAAHLPGADKKYDVVFLDPPYQSNLVKKTLSSLAAGGWLAEGAIILVEESERETLEIPEVYKVKNERRYGNTKLYILELT